MQGESRAEGLCSSQMSVIIPMLQTNFLQIIHDYLHIAYSTHQPLAAVHEGDILKKDFERPFFLFSALSLFTMSNLDARQH